MYPRLQCHRRCAGYPPHCRHGPPPRCAADPGRVPDSGSHSPGHDGPGGGRGVLYGPQEPAGPPGHRRPVYPPGGGGPAPAAGRQRRPLLRPGPARRLPHSAGGRDPQQPRAGGASRRPGVSPGRGGGESVRPGARPDAAVLPGGPGHSRRPGIRRLFRPLPGGHRVPEHPGPGLRRGVRRPLTGLGHRHPPRGPLRSPAPPCPGHRAPGHRALQLLPFQHPSGDRHRRPGGGRPGPI